jgi:hypothetical protein
VNFASEQIYFEVHFIVENREFYRTGIDKKEERVYNGLK